MDTEHIRLLLYIKSHYNPLPMPSRVIGIERIWPETALAEDCSSDDICSYYQPHGDMWKSSGRWQGIISELLLTYPPIPSMLEKYTLLTKGLHSLIFVTAFFFQILLRDERAAVLSQFTVRSNVMVNRESTSGNHWSVDGMLGECLIVCSHTSTIRIQSSLLLTLILQLGFTRYLNITISNIGGRVGWDYRVSWVRFHRSTFTDVLLSLLFPARV